MIDDRYGGDLLVAAEFGNTDQVERLLNLGVNPDWEGRLGRGRTALSIACRNNHWRVLLDRGANIENEERDTHRHLDVLLYGNYHGRLFSLRPKLLLGQKRGKAPLFIASSQGHVETVRLLLDRGANLHHYDNDGKTSLFVATSGGYLEVVRLLLDRGAHINHQDNIGRTPLSWAVHCNRLEIAKHLLDGGANLEHEEEDGRTPLFWSINKEYLAMTRLLLDHGANIHHQDNNGCTTLIVASSCHKRGRVVEEKQTHSGQVVSSTNDHLETIRLLLDRGANPEQQDKDGRTVLSWVALNDHISIAQLLLRRGGARINHQDSCGRTPLLLAIIYRHVQMTKLLLDHGARIDLHDYDGRTPLHCALGGTNGRHRETFVYLLVQAGAQNDATHHTFIKQALQLVFQS